MIRARRHFAHPSHPFRDLTVAELILVVDDEPSIRRLAMRALLEEGFDVLEAGDGEQALEIVDAGGVSVLVSDVVMPRLNGVQLMERLARSHPELPVVLMSGYAAPELAAMGIAAPCALLAKPFTPDRLVEEVRRCLGGTDPLALAGEAGG
jgi:two-component system, cell cycle sensor histidine kinase and response regulator CckA